MNQHLAYLTLRSHSLFHRSSTVQIKSKQLRSDTRIDANGVSVVIPTIGREAVVLDTVSDLTRQAGVDFEIIIVTQSTQTLDEVQSLAVRHNVAARCYYQSEPNASLARNVGLREAKFNVVLFIDDDMHLPNIRFLESHLAPFEEPSLAGVAGQVLLPGQEPRTRALHYFASRKRVGWLYFPPTWTKPDSVRNGISCNLSVRKDLALDVGGMDANFVKGAHREESDFCLRLTDKHGLLAFSPAASAVHLHVPSGGCRSWNDRKIEKPNSHANHHLAGEWYFLLRGLQLGTIGYLDLPDYFFALAKRHLWYRPNGKRFQGGFKALLNSLEGLLEARRWLKSKPRLVDSVSNSEYKLVWEVTPKDQTEFERGQQARH
ncbi:glycosyltransferase family 2 protein [Rhodopirellula sp. P2]|uniref:glycosyltransferase family 2 protein n=1 Tax=Rhodopirellula sp. P2 TaxID=2127060 RepID=UPI002368C0CC|nr:glycosyltransferase [Rhodopirellula sp. P2]WDQ15655.1 glycosyltransferase [Rhodopirellula sp. P2]